MLVKSTRRKHKSVDPSWLPFTSCSVKWEPEEIGRGPADEFDRFVQFKARQEATAKPPSAV